MTEEQITEIRNLYAGGMQQKNIARQFGLKVRFVGMIIRGEKGYARVSQSEHRRKCIDCGAGSKKSIRCDKCRQLYDRQYNTAYQRERRAKARERSTKDHDHNAK